FGNKGIISILIQRGLVLLLGQQLLFLQRSLPRIRHHVVFVIDDALQIAGSDVEQQTETAWHALQEPDVRDRYGQLDVAHTLTAHAGDSNVYAATLTSSVFVLDALVLTTSTLVVTDR